MRLSARGVREVGSTAVVLIAALALVTIYLKDRSRAQAAGGSALEEVEDWRNWSPSALRMGPDDAPVVVAAFMDFQCPYCRRLVPVFDSLRAAFGNEIAIELYHFTLPNHPQSVPAAIAAECADQQGWVEEMWRTIFANMDALGSTSWTSLGEEAGVPDIEAFDACTRLPWKAFPRIAAGKELGLSVGVEGTPTIWVNGTLMRGRTLASFQRRAREIGVGVE